MDYVKPQGVTLRSLVAAVLVFSGYIAIGMWIAWSTLSSKCWPWVC